MPQTEALKPEDLGKTASQPTAANRPRWKPRPEAKPEVKKLVEAKPVEKPPTSPSLKLPSRAGQGVGLLRLGHTGCQAAGPGKGWLPSLKLKAEQVVESSKGEVKGNGKFWVYHPPLATQSETQTLSAELKDKGFDNYIVHSAEFKGSVSLGLFGQEATAKAMQAG
jgi:hypothetical protein